MDYEMYPRVMKHPHYKPAIPYQQPRYRPGQEGWGQPVVPGETGKPAKFPDVVVNNKDQEQQYAALGYVPSGTPDPESYRRLMTGNDERPKGTHMEYPKMLYRKSEKKGVDLDYATVNDKEEEEKQLAKGWFLHPAEARGETEEKPEPEVREPVTRVAKKKGKHLMSAEARQAASERMKKMHAEKKARKETQAQA